MFLHVCDWPLCIRNNVWIGGGSVRHFHPKFARERLHERDGETVVRSRFIFGIHGKRTGTLIRFALSSLAGSKSGVER